MSNSNHYSSFYGATPKRNFSNDIRKGGDRPWVLGTLIYEGVKLERGGKVGSFHFFPVFSSCK